MEFWFQFFAGVAAVKSSSGVIHSISADDKPKCKSHAIDPWELIEPQTTWYGYIDRWSGFS
jgi:hypothetical protein